MNACVGEVGLRTYGLYLSSEPPCRINSPVCSMVHSVLVATLLLPLSVASSALASGPAAGQIKNLVTFGDSYTDVVSPHATRPR